MEMQEIAHLDCPRAVHIVHNTIIHERYIVANCSGMFQIYYHCWPSKCQLSRNSILFSQSMLDHSPIIN